MNDDNDLVIPPLDPPITADGVPTPFGHAVRDKYFDIPNGVHQLNHGSYGCCPHPVTEGRIKLLRDKLTAFPDHFFRCLLPKYMLQARTAAAEFLDADLDSLVLVNNATTATNAFMSSFPMQPGDKLLVCASTVYVACLSTLRFYEARRGIQVICFDLTYPLSNDEIVAAYCASLDEHKPKFCVFDTVSSAPSVRMPWERLTAECRRRNVISMVDGAHGAGLIPISLRAARPDFFTTNFHKWTYAPDSCSAMYVDKQWHSVVHSCPISAPYIPSTAKVADEATRFASQFNYTGTTDYTPFASLVYALEFVKAMGGQEKIEAYCYDLARRAGDMYAKELGTELLHGKQDDVRTSMLNVRIPLKAKSQEQLREIVGYMCAHQIKEFKTYLPIFVYSGQPWVRLSAQIYLDMSDFDYGLHVLKTLLETCQTLYPEIEVTLP